MYLCLGQTSLVYVDRNQYMINLAQDEFSLVTLFFYSVILLVSSSERDVIAKGSPACLAYTSNLLLILGS